MTDLERKEAISKTLTDSLNKIAESAVEEMKKSIDAPEKPEKTEAETNSTTQEDSNKNQEDVVAIVKSLADKLESIETKLNAKPETTEEKISKSQGAVKEQVVELVKSMGIDPNNVDVNFVIKEKKKSEVNTEDGDKFTNDNSGEDFEKQFEALPTEQKQEALSEFFKSVIKR